MDTPLLRHGSCNGHFKRGKERANTRHNWLSRQWDSSVGKKLRDAGLPSPLPSWFEILK